MNDNPLEALLNLVKVLELTANEFGVVTSLRTRVLNALNALGIVGGSTIVRKAVIQTQNNNAILTNDTELFFPIAANELKQFEFYIFIVGNSTADIKFSIIGPVGVNGNWVCFGSGLTGSTLISGGDDVWDGSVSISFGSFTPPAISLVRIPGLVVNGANAGTIQLQWAQNAAIVGDTSVIANSYVTHQTL